MSFPQVLMARVRAALSSEDEPSPDFDQLEIPADPNEIEPEDGLMPEDEGDAGSAIGDTSLIDLQKTREWDGELL